MSLIVHPPILAAIKERVQLNSPSSEKKTFHLALDLRDHQLEYAVGDCIGVYPTNSPDLITRILHALKATGDEKVVTREEQTTTLLSFLTTRANLLRANKKLLRLVNLAEEEMELIDFLEKKSPRLLSPQELVDHLSPLIPRFYSIASAHKSVGGEIHLTVALTQYEVEGDKRYGCCSQYLCHQAPLGESVIPIYLHKAKDFTLTEESFSKPIIMIGPGTGVAPFRGFMQERVRRGAKENWLFFGERHRDSDFYYQEYWEQLVRSDFLRLDLAFSRDGPQKVYVQHLMEKNSKEFWQWLERGALIFVCGDAMRMAKDVETTLLKLISSEGKMSQDEAKAYLKELRKNKRYLRDVY